ncbi:hypothetical protein [Methylocapsa acidiphila]|uniref:hypothetical protein n=1 Tax=Methylocapsa acidiphila TaxID=133552 RepID=UPI000415229B|nr:hypothetical protein [Methylocapsa acidiphila]
MPRSQTAYLDRKDAPSRKDLQQAITGLKFKLELDHAYAPFKTAGYLPCTLEGEDAGFDMRFQDVDADLSKFPALQAQIGARDAAIAFRWSGDVREFASAMIVGAALAKSFGAVLHDPDADAILSAEDLIAKAREAVASL